MTHCVDRKVNITPLPANEREPCLLEAFEHLEPGETLQAIDDFDPSWIEPLIEQQCDVCLTDQNFVVDTGPAVRVLFEGVCPLGFLRGRRAGSRWGRGYRPRGDPLPYRESTCLELLPGAFASHFSITRTALPRTLTRFWGFTVPSERRREKNSVRFSTRRFSSKTPGTCLDMILNSMLGE